MPNQLLFEKQLPQGKFQTFDGPPDFKFKELNQVHGINCVREPNLEADGFFIEEDSNYCIKTADCLPVLLIGKHQTAFLHVGWKGLYNGILLQDSIKEIKAEFVLIGPHIKSCCFEVTAEFKNYFKDKNFSYENDQLYFDLQTEVLDQLGNLSSFTESACTFCNDKFNSYRRDKTTRRNYNIYAVR